MLQQNIADSAHDTCATKFKAKTGALTQMIQKTLYERAKEVKTKDEKMALLKCHSEISESISAVIG